jgi:hypothetical protein
MNIDKSRILGFVFVLLGVLILLHHLTISGRLFDLGDILHHEFFEAIFFTAGMVLLLIARPTKVAGH